MDVVSSETRNGLPSELLYADDLVIMAPTMEQLGRRVANWRASLLGKGLKVNAGKSKVMVGSSGGKMIVNSGKWPCGVCGKGVQTNSVQCTVCKKWIHKRCSGVRGDLSRVVDGFRCRRCDGTIQEVDIADDLMVEHQTDTACAWLVCHSQEGLCKLYPPYLASPEAQARFLGGNQSCNPAAWLAERHLLAGDIESNTGPKPTLKPFYTHAL